MNNTKRQAEYLSKLLAKFSGSIVYSNSQNYFVNNSWPLTNACIENMRVYNFNPREDSETFNWLPLCKARPNLSFKLANTIINGDVYNLGHFFTQTTIDLLAAMFSHISTLKLATPTDVYDSLINSEPNELILMLEVSENPTVRRCTKTFTTLNKKIQVAILSLIEQKLSFLQNDQVRKITSTTSRTPDFSSLKRQETLILWLVPKEESLFLEPLTNLFFALLGDQLEKANGNLTVDILANCNYSNGKFSLSEAESLSGLSQYNLSVVNSFQEVTSFVNYQ